MPIDFPSNPTNGQVYGNWIYDSSITAWRNVNTDTGIGTLNAMGLKNVVPTSIAVGSGSATVNANGTVSFTAVNSIALNGIFTSTYDNYRYILSVRGASTGTTGVLTRFRASGTNTSTGYYWGGYIAYITANTLSSYRGDNAAEVLSGFVNGSSYAVCSADVFSPQKATPTSYTTQSTGSDGSYFTLNNSGFQIGNTQFDGISIQTSANSITGTLQVFGYNG